jgi:hypothetical protein
MRGKLGGEGGGVGLVPRGGKEMGERGPWAQRSTARDEGCGQQQPSAVGGRWQCCCMNRGERRGVGDAALRDRQVGPGGNGARWSAAGCGRKREKRASAAAGHRQVGPTSTVPGHGLTSVLNRFKIFKRFK